MRSRKLETRVLAKYAGMELTLVQNVIKMYNKLLYKFK